MEILQGNIPEGTKIEVDAEDERIVFNSNLS
jgi:hypothetical protein